MTESKNEHSFTPISLTGYKQYAPNDNYKSDFVYVIKLEPFDRFENPEKERINTDNSILQVAKIVDEYSNK